MYFAFLTFNKCLKKYKLLKIKEIRKSKGYTQKEVCDATGINLRTWSSYENGQSSPPADVLKNIAGFLKVSIGELFGEKIMPTRSQSEIKKSSQDSKNEYAASSSKEIIVNAGDGSEYLLKLIQKSAKDIAIKDSEIKRLKNQMDNENFSKTEELERLRKRVAELTAIVSKKTDNKGLE